MSREFLSESDPRTGRTEGLYRGRSVARVVTSPDGFVILVGRSAKDNDIVTFKLGRPYDFWLHVVGESGSHVVVLNDEKASRMPRATEQLAAGLAAGYSKARTGGQVSVHWTTCNEVRKPRGAPPGKVSLSQFQRTKATPVQLD